MYDHFAGGRDQKFVFASPGTANLHSELKRQTYELANLHNSLWSSNYCLVNRTHTANVSRQIRSRKAECQASSLISRSSRAL
jgi:hypothetical protein